MSDNKIRQKRKELCLSTKELSMMTKIPESKIFAYENNEVNATKATIKKICKATNTKINDWVDDTYFYYEKKVEFTKEERGKALDTYFQALIRSDNAIIMTFDALIEMKELEYDNGKILNLSDFAQNLFVNVVQEKMKVISQELKVYRKDHIPSPAPIIIEEGTHDFEILVSECKNILSNNDVESMDVIIRALNEMGYIDKSGQPIGKAINFFSLIVSQRIKNVSKNKKEA